MVGMKYLAIFSLLLATTLAQFPQVQRKLRPRVQAKLRPRVHAKLSGVQQQDEAICDTISWSSRKLNNEKELAGGWAVVCQEPDGDVCYNAGVKRCCSYNSNLTVPILKKVLTVGSSTVDATVLNGGSEQVPEACLFLSPTDIEVCPNPSRCFPAGCQNPATICTNNSNSLGDCDPSGCTSCKEGYAEPSCCDCEENYGRAEDGSCQFVCSSNCNGPSSDPCSSCSHPYTGAPFCCNCTPPFVKNDDGICVCPPDTIEIDGSCESICTQNTVSCANPPCCKTGYKPPLCCECVFNETEGGELYFGDNEQCKPICRENALVQNCNVNSGCSSCKDSFDPPDCCECKDPLELYDGVCRFCPPGEVYVDGKCQTICTDNIVPGSCTQTSCQCLTGYASATCCDCASGYVADGQTCRRCPPGFVPDSTQTKCICDPDNGVQIIVDGKCVPVCTTGAILSTCTETSCQCRPGYLPDDCCECASGYIVVGNKCTKCPEGFVPDSSQTKCICDPANGVQIIVNGKCVPVCTNGAILSSCTETSCSCQDGYLPPDCCKCASGYISDGSDCKPCPDGFVPDSDQTSCICDPSNGRQIVIDGKCTPVCKEAIDCTETSCTCPPLLSPPDCCKCLSGAEPTNGVCPVPCIDDQDIFILMDRSTGNSDIELSYAMYAIELITGTLLRNTNNLNVIVMSYAQHSYSTSLINLTPSLSTGKDITSSICNTMLTSYEAIIQNARYSQPIRSTYSGLSIQLLKNYINKGRTTTVITFAGTTSNQPEENLITIAQGIKAIKSEFGENNVRFISVGYEGQNFPTSESETQYFAEVKALANGQSTQTTSLNIQTDPSAFLTSVATLLNKLGILCEEQKNNLLSLSDTTFKTLFYKYFECLVPSSIIPGSGLPCISKEGENFNYVCFTESANQQLEDRQTLLSLMKHLLEQLSN